MANSDLESCIFYPLTAIASRINLCIKLELKDEEKNLKDLERDLTKLEKLNEKYHKQIEDWKAKIAENEQLIDQNLLDQEGAQRAIDDQKEVIRSVEVKLANAEN